MISIESQKCPRVKTAQFIRRNPERVDNTHPTPPPVPSMDSPPPHLSFRGEVSQAHLLAWVAGVTPWNASPPGVPRRTRAMERQRLTHLHGLAGGSWGKLRS